MSHYARDEACARMRLTRACSLVLVGNWPVNASSWLLLLFIEQKPKAFHTVNEKENVERQGTYRFTSKH